MAAYAAAQGGKDVLLLEKNEKLGKKIYITGKGRCNLTNDCPPDALLEHIVRGGKFFTRTAYLFPPARTMEFFSAHGLALKTERGNRVFPQSDHASDVTATLERACRGVGVKIALNEAVCRIVTENGGVTAVETDRARYDCNAAIVACGGLSYPSTGSTGDGYRFAKACGHDIVTPVPSLVGVELIQKMGAAQGVSQKNCRLTAVRGGKEIYGAMGELLFTHYGIGGPLVLTLSAQINRIPPEEIALYLDLKPALDEKTLDDRLLRDFAERKNEQLKNVMRGLLPAGVTALVLRAAGVRGDRRANGVTREERSRLLRALKALPLTPVRLRGFEEAVVTSGGVSLKEIDPKTMKSKLVAGLSFCGEVLDLDAYTGGYNLQIAFSSGYIAGENA